MRNFEAEFLLIFMISTMCCGSCVWLKLLCLDSGKFCSSASNIASVIVCVAASTESLALPISGKEVVAYLWDS